MGTRKIAVGFRDASEIRGARSSVLGVASSQTLCQNPLSGVDRTGWEPKLRYGARLPSGTNLAMVKKPGNHVEINRD